MMDPVLIRCIGCGTPLGSEPASQGVIDHAFACAKHPVAIELRKTRDVLSEWIKATVAARDRGTLDDQARADFNAALALTRELR